MRYRCKVTAGNAGNANEKSIMKTGTEKLVIVTAAAEITENWRISSPHDAISERKQAVSPDLAAPRSASPRSASSQHRSATWHAPSFQRAVVGNTSDLAAWTPSKSLIDCIFGNECRSHSGTAHVRHLPPDPVAAARHRLPARGVGPARAAAAAARPGRGLFHRRRSACSAPPGPAASSPAASSRRGWCAGSAMCGPSAPSPRRARSSR